MDAVSFGISAAVAHLLTNIDNLAIMAGLLLTSGRSRVIGGFLVAQAIVLGVSIRLGESLGDQLPLYTGYLGVIPVVLGFGALWRRIRVREEAESIALTRVSIFAIVALFLSVSVDTFAIFAPAMADSDDVYRVAALLGASISAVALGLVALSVGRLSGGVMRRLIRLDTVAPFVMIAVGFYVIANTGTDVH